MFDRFVQWLTMAILNAVMYFFDVIVEKCDFNSTTVNTYFKIIYSPEIVDAFKELAYIVAFVGIFIAGFKLIISPINGKASEHPMAVVGRVFIAYVLIMLAPALKNYLFNIFHYISEAAASGVGLERIKKLDAAKSTKSLLEVMFEKNTMPFFGGLVLAVTLGKEAITAVVSIFERFVSLLLYIEVGPLCMSFYVNRETEDIPAIWIKGLLSQAIAWFFVEWLVYAFMYIANGDEMLKFSDSPLFTMLMMSVLLHLIANIERFLGAFGLHTLPNLGTAASVASSLANGAKMGMGFATGAGKALMKTGLPQKAVGGAYKAAKEAITGQPKRDTKGLARGMKPDAMSAMDYVKSSAASLPKDEKKALKERAKANGRTLAAQHAAEMADANGGKIGAPGHQVPLTSEMGRLLNNGKADKMNARTVDPITRDYMKNATSKGHELDANGAALLKDYPTPPPSLAKTLLGAAGVSTGAKAQKYMNESLQKMTDDKNKGVAAYNAASRLTHGLNASKNPALSDMGALTAGAPAATGAQKAAIQARGISAEAHTKATGEAANNRFGVIAPNTRVVSQKSESTGGGYDGKAPLDETTSMRVDPRSGRTQMVLESTNPNYRTGEAYGSVAKIGTAPFDLGDGRYGYVLEKGDKVSTGGMQHDDINEKWAGMVGFQNAEHGVAADFKEGVTAEDIEKYAVLESDYARIQDDFQSSSNNLSKAETEYKEFRDQYSELKAEQAHLISQLDENDRDNYFTFKVAGEEEDKFDILFGEKTSNGSLTDEEYEEMLNTQIWKTKNRITAEKNYYTEHQNELKEEIDAIDEKAQDVGGNLAEYKDKAIQAKTIYSSIRAEFYRLEDNLKQTRYKIFNQEDN